MLRVNVTVVALVTGDRSALDRLAAPNVDVARVDPDRTPIERAEQACRAAARSGRRYLVHDADPLSGVAEAWAGFFDGTAPHGTIEVAVESVLSRWRADAVVLPDYYLLDDVDSLPASLRQWYLGVLADAAVHRVVVRDLQRPILDHLGSLPTGPWWDPLDLLLAGIEHRVPGAPRGSEI